ncbi:hypothetical protein RKE29_02935 [Streptomyces sp. B1866]|uniref:hypothetical protein n=1 Tax=Streptomyces sp. B1866 TaxID=3075431 RepID=UPI0028923650|nr:hypothetical protein [Streptomyces sp. B1866]MDT3395615.1 hypothetical protein [Streptomyces sp. B1866]
MHSSLTPSDTVAGQVRRHRTRLGLNREQLAAECARLGAPDLTYAALTNIETGRRNKDGKRRRDVSVDELLVLGLALAVPPLLLLLPLGAEETVPTVPTADPRDTYTAWKWITGQETPALAGPVGGRYYPDPRTIGEDGPKWAAAWAAAAYPASLYPEFERRRYDVLKAQRRTGTGQDSHRPEDEREHGLDREYVDRLGDLAHVINDMTRVGLTVPRCEPEWVEAMTALDMLVSPDAVPTDGGNA